MRDQQAEHEACGLRDQRRDCRAGNSEVEHQHQHGGRRHVDEVDGDLHAERQFGAGLPDQPSEHDIVAERQRRRPDPDDEVGFGRTGDALAATHGVEQKGGERNLQGNQRRANQRRDDQPAHQDRAQLRGLA